MKKIVLKVLQLQNQSKIMHWQTNSHAEHMAYGGFYEAIDALSDRLIEVIQGKYGVRIMFGGIDSIQVSDYSNLKVQVFLLDMCSFFTNEIFECGISKDDRDICAIIDEINNEIAKLKYLLTLR